MSEHEQGRRRAPELDGLQAAIRTAEEHLFRCGDVDAAQAALDDVHKRFQVLGIRSAFLSWLRAIAADRSGRLLEALDLVEEAMCLDPGALQISNSRRVILNRIREAIVGEDCDIKDPELPKLWEVLARAGVADEEIHLVMARHKLATGDNPGALWMAKAIRTLYPGSAAAWELTAEVATAMGDAATAATAIAEAAALGHEPVPFMLVEAADA